MSENPYATPTDPGFILAERQSFKDMPTRELKKLRNDSHSIRAIAVLMMLGTGLVLLVIVGLMTTEYLGVMEIGILLGMVAFQGVVSIAMFKRPNWGRVIGFISAVFMLLGFPVGTLIGILFLISLVRGERLFGPDRILHKDLEAEWKYRRKNKVE
ncbi:MAG: hypothetical protein MUF13_00350 [Akkermansiaceae bacterium]|jgi:hypothetical protein|nr:hypothetical protein [Akkermansiaceae bacterium]